MTLGFTLGSNSNSVTPAWSPSSGHSVEGLQTSAVRRAILRREGAAWPSTDLGHSPKPVLQAKRPIRLHERPRGPRHWQLPFPTQCRDWVSDQSGCR